MPITIKYHSKLNTEYIEQSIQILNEGLGKNYITPDIIKRYNNDKAISFLLALSNNKMVGISIFHIGNESEIAPHLLKKYTLILQEIEQKTIAFHLHIVVAKAYRNQGIAQQLIAKSQEIFQSKADIMISTAWAESKEIIRLYTKNDFKAIAEIADFWYEDSLKKQYACPVCGNPPCRCKAQFFVYYF